MPETVPPKTEAPAVDERDRERRRPSLRNRTIFERRVLGGETLAALATEYKVTHQRIAQIATRVEGWIAGHPEDQLANRLRLRCRLRYEALYESAVTGFADSRKEEVTVKQRTTKRAAKSGSPNAALRSADERPSEERKATIADEKQDDVKPEVVTTVEERITRQRHGDPRLLATAMKAVEKLEQFAASLDRFDARAAPKNPAKPDDREARESRIQQRIANETAWLAARDARVAAEKEDAEKAAAAKAAAGAQVSGASTGVREENRTSAPSSSLPTAGCRLPTAPATRHTPLATQPSPPATQHTPLVTQPATRHSPHTTLPKHVLIVGHYKQIDRMSDLAQTQLPGFEITATDTASIAKEWIDKHAHEAAAIWLENDLGPTREVPGGTIRPGTGREVAVRLVQARPRCRVLVNEGDDHSRPLYRLLDAAACSVEEVLPGGGDWLRDSWLPALRRALRLPEEDDDFDFEDEDEDDYGDEDDDELS